MHPINLALRFALELGALAALAMWGWSLADGWWRWLTAIGIVLVAATVWGTFAVPDDPSRGGQGLVHVPGAVRLAIELLFFAAGAYAFRAVGRPGLAIAFGVVVLAHYAWSYERIAWLLKQ
jgi:hypothetical protein